MGFKMLLRSCLWANLAIASSFTPSCPRFIDNLSRRSTNQKLLEPDASTCLVHPSRRDRSGFFASAGGAKDPQHFKFEPSDDVQHNSGSVFQLGQLPAASEGGLQNDSVASQRGWIDQPFVGSASALTAPSELGQNSAEYRRLEEGMGKTGETNEPCARAILYSSEHTPREAKAPDLSPRPELAVADAEKEQAGRGTHKLGDQPLWNGKWDGRRGVEGAEDKDVDARRAVVLEAWELVRKEYLHQDSLAAMHLPSSGPLAQVARENPHCFDNGVTWDAIGEAVKAHRFASVSESHNVIRDMLAMLDDRYAVFYSAQQLSDLVDGIDPPAPQVSNTAGVGLVLRGGWVSQVQVNDDDGCGHPTARIVPHRVFKIRRVAMESPALRAGLREGDSILSIDGEPSSSIPSLTLAQSLFKGQRGERLEVEVVRGDGGAGRMLRGGLREETLWESLQGRQAEEGGRGAKEVVAVRRGVLPSEQAVWGMAIEGGRDGADSSDPVRVGYISLHDFNTRTIDEFRQILRNFQKSPAAPNLYVIDLRNNMGGLLSSGIGLCEELLPRGAGIVQLVGGHGPVDTHSVLSSSSSLPPLVPLIVLVNEGTASSSELAAAVKDAGRGLLVGKRTFGKGTVQAIVRMRDQSAVQLTIGRGIEPHVHADLPAEEEAVGRVLASYFRSGAAVQRALAAAS